MGWTVENMPSQDGKLAIVTGASGGLGLETAKALAAKGAQVIVAARNEGKAVAAVSEIGRIASFELLDLADLQSVRDFAARFISIGRPVNLLINNAGLAGPPRRQVTRDGFEIQFGTNFLGHFLLTALLLPLLIPAHSPRIVTVSSLVDKRAKLSFEDLMSERHYSPTKSYGQSKLASLIFSRELQRRSDAEGWGVLSLSAHPGIAVTELTKARPGQPVLRFNSFFELVSPYIGQTAQEGALSILFAATSPDAEPGSYYGPTGFLELKGPPGLATSSKVSRDPRVAAQLWAVAEAMTGISFECSSRIGTSNVKTT